MCGRGRTLDEIREIELDEGLRWLCGFVHLPGATDIGPNEAVLGFPGDRLAPIVEKLEFLAEKAIPRSRAKTAFSGLSSAVTRACYLHRSSG